MQNTGRPIPRRMNAANRGVCTIGKGGGAWAMQTSAFSAGLAWQIEGFARSEAGRAPTDADPCVLCENPAANGGVCTMRAREGVAKYRPPHSLQNERSKWRGLHETRFARKKRRGLYGMDRIRLRESCGNKRASAKNAAVCMKKACKPPRFMQRRRRKCKLPVFMHSSCSDRGGLHVGGTPTIRWDADDSRRWASELQRSRGSAWRVAQAPRF